MGSLRDTLTHRVCNIMINFVATPEYAGKLTAVIRQGLRRADAVGPLIVKDGTIDRDAIERALHQPTELASMFGGYDCLCGNSWLTDRCTAYEPTKQEQIDNVMALLKRAAQEGVSND